MLHNPNPMKESEAVNWIISMGTIVFGTSPATIASEMVAMVAVETVKRTL